jgi:uncharacterized protein YccT (UPF0319 family)
LTNENTGALNAYGQQVAAAMSPSNRPISPTSPTSPASPANPALPASPNGTKITAASASPIIDKNGNSWSLVQSATASQGLQIAVNGQVDPNTYNVAVLEILNGNIVQENASGGWFQAGNGSWTALSGNPNPVPSASGTTITSASAKPIIDQNGNSWSLVQSATASQGLQIACNGQVDQSTYNVAALEIVNGNIVQENASGAWYQAANGSWSALAANPNPAPSPAPTPVPSPNGTTITSASGKPIIDQSGNSWSLVQSATASQGLQIACNGQVDQSTYNVAALEIVNGNIVQENASGAWYQAANGSWTALAGNPNPAPTVPSVAPGGSDTLVLKVSEDAYKGDAQFTVSVDGKQLGGTFTATAPHSSGATQDFTFKGDFGSGPHKVAVSFVNDLNGGSPSLDRNLYVNDVVYNGTDTKQGTALYANVTKTLSVSGGTTPSVTETSDHGSLKQNLSQTGTYTVGGDTIVLSNGNAASVTLGTGNSQLTFIGASSVAVTGGSGQAAVAADMGNNKFVAGAGSMDVAGGAGKDAYVFHATSGQLTVEDFSTAKGDTLTIDKSLQGSMQQAADGKGGTLLSFGTGHSVDLHGVVSLPSNNIQWS